MSRQGWRGRPLRRMLRKATQPEESVHEQFFYGEESEAEASNPGRHRGITSADRSIVSSVARDEVVIGSALENGAARRHVRDTVAVDLVQLSTQVCQLGVVRGLRVVL